MVSPFVLWVVAWWLTADTKLSPKSGSACPSSPDNGPAGPQEDRVHTLSESKVRSLNPFHFGLGCSSERLQATRSQTDKQLPGREIGRLNGSWAECTQRKSFIGRKLCFKYWRINTQYVQFTLFSSTCRLYRVAVHSLNLPPPTLTVSPALC